MENLGIFPLSSNPGCPPHFDTPRDGGVESLEGMLLQKALLEKLERRDYPAQRTKAIYHLCDEHTLAMSIVGKLK